VSELGQCGGLPPVELGRCQRAGRDEGGRLLTGAIDTTVGRVNSCDRLVEDRLMVVADESDGMALAGELRALTAIRAARRDVPGRESPGPQSAREA
jgi:hypothetical protein